MATKNSEMDEIRESGGVPQKNSGRGKVDKGDFTLAGIWLVDVKEYAKSFNISKSFWAKICSDAFKAGRYRPALKLVIGQAGGPRVRLWVISNDDMKEFVRLKEAENNVIIERTEGD
jgi:hypothetical protein